MSHDNLKRLGFRSAKDLCREVIPETLRAKLLLAPHASPSQLAARCQNAQDALLEADMPVLDAAGVSGQEMMQEGTASRSGLQENSGYPSLHGSQTRFST